MAQTGEGRPTQEDSPSPTSRPKLQRVRRVLPEGRPSNPQQKSCEGGLTDLLMVLPGIFACQGPQPLETARPSPRRYGAAQPEDKDDASSSSSSSSNGRGGGSAASDSGKASADPRSKWAKYVPQKSHRFSKVDQYVLKTLEDDEARALGLDPGTVRHELDAEEAVDKHITGSLPPERATLSEKTARTPATRPDNRRFPFFNHSDEMFLEFDACVPRLEFLRVNLEPYRVTSVDKLAKFNHGRDPRNLLVYIGYLLAWPCVSASRRVHDQDLRFSPWPEFPLSARDAEKWLLGDTDTKLLAKKFKEKVSPPLNGLSLRLLSSETPIMRLFNESAYERRCRDVLFANIEKLLLYEAELMSSWLMSAVKIVQREVLKKLPADSLPLIAHGTEAQKSDLANSIGHAFDIFAVAYERSLARQYHGPLFEWAAWRGSPLSAQAFVDRQTVVLLIWLTGGSSESLHKFLPKVKQLCFDRAVAAES